MSDDMSIKNLTDFAYESIASKEMERKSLVIIIISCFLIAVPSLGVSSFLLMAYLHQKGGLYTQDMISISALALISAILIVLGTNRVLRLKKIENKLKQFDLLEETIYSEVLKSRMDQFK